MQEVLSRRNYEDRPQDRLVETKVVYQLTFTVKQTILKSAILKQNHVMPMIWGVRNLVSGEWWFSRDGFIRRSDSWSCFFGVVLWPCVSIRLVLLYSRGSVGKVLVGNKRAQATKHKHVFYAFACIMFDNDLLVRACYIVKPELKYVGIIPGHG